MAAAWLVGADRREVARRVFSMGGAHRRRLQWRRPVETPHHHGRPTPRNAAMRTFAKGAACFHLASLKLALLALACLLSASLATAADQGLQRGQPSEVCMQAGPLAEIPRRM